MKPESLNENMTENIRELTLDELDEVSGGMGTGQAIVGVAAGGLMVLAAGETGGALSQAIRNVAAKYQ